MIVVIDHHAAHVYQDFGGSRPADEHKVQPYDPYNFHHHLIPSKGSALPGRAPAAYPMAATFERWGRRWLKYGSAAGWFASFLREQRSGPLSAARSQATCGRRGIASRPRLAPPRSRGPVHGSAIAVLENHQKDIEKDNELRDAFFRLLTALCARQIPEALNLRNKVSELLSVA